MSLSLDVLLCCGISAALTRTLPSRAEALWHWSGAMLCFAACFILVDLAFSGGQINPILAIFLPHAFAIAGCASLLAACLALNGRRSPRWSPFAAAGLVGLLALGLAFPREAQLRNALTLFACSGYALLGSCSFASERRWRVAFGGLLSILSLLSVAICSAALGMAELSSDEGIRLELAPFLFVFEAAILASSFAFILGAGELDRERAVELSMRDGLTGLLSRRAFMEAATPALAAAKRARAPCAMLMVDIDFFKRINDAHGHLAGDAAIIHASSLLERSLRASDICARFGGEEFCAFLPDTDVEGARQVANRILDSARAEPASFIDPKSGVLLTLPYTVSVGAHWQLADGELDARTLLAKADAALYASKRSGRDRFTMSGAPVRAGV